METRTTVRLQLLMTKQASFQGNILQQLSVPSWERCFLPSGFVHLLPRPGHTWAVRLRGGGRPEEWTWELNHVAKSRPVPFQTGTGLKGPLRPAFCPWRKEHEVKTNSENLEPQNQYISEAAFVSLAPLWEETVAIIFRNSPKLHSTGPV